MVETDTDPFFKSMSTLWSIPLQGSVTDSSKAFDSSKKFSTKIPDNSLQENLETQNLVPEIYQIQSLFLGTN